MSSIDDLIQQHCSDGVEHRALGDVGELIRGNGIQKSDFIESGVGCIHYGQIHTHYGTWATETKTFVSPELAARTRRARPGDLVIATTSEDDEAVGKAVAWLGAKEVAVGTDAFIFRHSLDPKYTSYFFQTENFHAQKRRHVTGTKVRRIGGGALANIRIPVPPIEIQREIVRVLDLFQSLEAELEAELEARRRQYAHYRDELLTFTNLEEGVRWVTLGDVASFTYGFTATGLERGSLRFIRITDINDDGKLRPISPRYVEQTLESARFLIQRGDLLVARTGASFGKTVLIDTDNPAVFASFLIRIAVDTTAVLPGYYWHFAQSDSYWRQANALASIGGQPQFNANALARVRLAVPPLEEQERIVAILDKFDALVNDLSIGLPAELAARRKQYEYYRDKLLTFPEAA